MPSTNAHEAPPSLLKAGLENRRRRRRPVLMAGLLAWDGHGLDCTIHDLHEYGARIGFARTVPLPERLFLINVRERTAHDASVAWRRDLQVGLSFHRNMPLAEIGDPALVFLKKLWLTRATR